MIASPKQAGTPDPIEPPPISDLNPDHLLPNLPDWRFVLLSVSSSMEEFLCAQVCVLHLPYYSKPVRVFLHNLWFCTHTTQCYFCFLILKDKQLSIKRTKMRWRTTGKVGTWGIWIKYFFLGVLFWLRERDFFSSLFCSLYQDGSGWCFSSKQNERIQANGIDVAEATSIPRTATEWKVIK